MASDLIDQTPSEGPVRGRFGGKVIDEGDESADLEAEDEGEEEAVVGRTIPIPAETFVEELSGKLEVHPISVYWLLKEGREKEGWRCPPEEKRLMEDRLTVLVLRLLGHRWPRQVEAGEPVPDWADRDGVIPLTPGCGEPILADRVDERFAAEFPDSTVAAVKREFAEVVGQPLDEWLAGPFFTRHISQFRKRPIAWQIQSRPQATAGGGRRRRGMPQARPAFACLVYYHKLDADLLPKLRTHYVGPLRARFETELRTLEAVASPTDEQSTRRVELGNRIEELKSFDDQLSEVITSGFGPDAILSRLRSAAIAEAVLVLKAAWLRKLGTEIQSGPMEGWTSRAKKTELHPDLCTWIVNSIERIETYCSQVGPAPDSQKQWDDEPDARQVADFITSDTPSLVKDALRCICDAWWAEFDLGVVQPLRSQITELNESIKQVEAELEVKHGPRPERSTALQGRDQRASCASQGGQGEAARLRAVGAGNSPGDRGVDLSRSGFLANLARVTTTLRPIIEPRWTAGTAERCRRVRGAGTRLLSRSERWCPC